MSQGLLSCISFSPSALHCWETPLRFVACSVRVFSNWPMFSFSISVWIHFFFNNTDLVTLNLSSSKKNMLPCNVRSRHLPTSALPPVAICLLLFISRCCQYLAYVLSNCRMTGMYWIRKDLEGSGHDLTEIISRQLVEPISSLRFETSTSRAQILEPVTTLCRN
jgi:hypothetical protein